MSGGERRWRSDVRGDDPGRVRALIEATGFFNPAEVCIAADLVEERLVRGDASGYRFLFAEVGPALLGYSCFGPIAGTQASYDLYWIAVAPQHQRAGVGTALLERSETLVANAGGHRVYVETSTRAQYLPSRSFYHRRGYREQAKLADYYGPGDGKLILLKVLASSA